MRQEKANYSIKRMARLLKVSQSGYYKWPHTQDQQAAGNDEREAYMAEVDHKIRQIFNDSECVYGSPRVTAELACRYRITLNRTTVAKRMRLMGLEGISPRMFAPVKPLDSQRTSSIPNLVTRVFDAGELNRVWMSDITYLRTGEGWLYLCVVRDGHSRRVLGWAMDSVHNTDLVERALRMAYTLRGGGADGVVFHADRGAQFMSGLHQGVLRQCDGRVVLVDAENRVLQPSTLRHPR
ncbi:Integrase core domain protein [Corynebacterium diphtheriae subsp. lausannense]|nr:Integrase core domain protein [Corynebacterium diphtheriae subsp. lausannense]